MARKIGGRSSQQQRAGKVSAARTQQRVAAQRNKINKQRAYGGAMRGKMKKRA